MYKKQLPPVVDLLLHQFQRPEVSSLFQTTPRKTFRFLTS